MAELSLITSAEKANTNNPDNLAGLPKNNEARFEFPLRYEMESEAGGAHYAALLNGIKAFHVMLDRWNESYDSSDKTPIPTDGLRLWVEALRALHRALYERGNEFGDVMPGKIGYCGIADGLDVLEQLLRSQDQIDYGADVLWCAERLEEHRLQTLEWLNGV